MKVVMTGGTGMIGSALRKNLEGRGHEVFIITRNPKTDRDIYWDVEKNTIDLTKMGPMDGCVHLAGEPLFGIRWTRKKRERIWSSRVDSTKMLIDAFAERGDSLKTFLCGSAVGYYGHQSREELDARIDELSPSGEGYLAELCTAWESAGFEAEERLNARVVVARTGLVIGKEGGILQTMKTPFSIGMGGRLGNGEQGMSWITLRDEVSALTKLLEDETMSGAYNLVAPVPVSNEHFSSILAEVMGRKSWLHVPEWAIKSIFGLMGRELMLSGVYAVPKRLIESGFNFQDDDLKQALRDNL